jgi:hypothetical protein
MGPQCGCGHDQGTEALDHGGGLSRVVLGGHPGLLPLLRRLWPDAMVDAMSASGTPAQVGAKLREFGRHIDHVIVYPASFGMTDARSRQVTADLLKAAAPG